MYNSPDDIRRHSNHHMSPDADEGRCPECYMDYNDCECCQECGSTKEECTCEKDEDEDDS